MYILLDITLDLDCIYIIFFNYIGLGIHKIVVIDICILILGSIVNYFQEDKLEHNLKILDVLQDLLIIYHAHI